MSVYFDSARALLLDIEGTTTPISFVYRTLFPFAAAHAEQFLEHHATDKEVLHLIEKLRVHRESQVGDGSEPRPWSDGSASERLHSAAVHIRELIERDSKITPLKSLQGKIWETGYKEGKLRGEVYRDVPVAFKRWSAQGRRIAIFSSGSALAQRLLFRYSTAGDLTGFIDTFFDTTIGPKQESESYQRIAAALSFASAEILFLSDTTAELDAARNAGMQTALSQRPDLSRPETLTHQCFETFDEVLP